MSPDFLIYHTFDAILGHIPFRLRFVDFHRVACSSPLTRITHLMMDDLMSPNFLIYHTFDVILEHIPFRLRFVDFHGVACSSLLTRITHLMRLMI